MTIKWMGNSPEKMSAALGARAAGGKRILTEVMTDVVEEAADRMVATVETTPSGLVPGKVGRVWTGNMRDEIRALPVKVQDKQVIGEWGWPTPEDYFKYQEYGEAAGRRSIPPMMALLGSFIWARGELRTRITSLMGSRL